MTTSHSQASRTAISRGLIVAGSLLGSALVIKHMAPAHISAELASRLMGGLMGVVVIIYANDVPKALTPLVQMRCDAVAEQTMRRFVGWSLTLGGAAYVVGWLVAPFRIAGTLTVSLLGASLLLSVLRLIGCMTRGSRT